MNSPIQIMKAIELKKYIVVIYRYVTNVMCPLCILRHVSADCVLLAFGNVSDLKKLQIFIIFGTIYS